MSKRNDEKHYDHSRKIGNEGDAIKHPVLLKVVETLARSVVKKPFVYAESHTGRPFYVLQEGGEWERGVGKLSANELLWGARSALTINAEGTQSLANLRPYVDESFLEPLRPGSLYPGSSGLVFRLLWRLGISFRFFLWERDEAACEDLMSSFPQWREIHVCRGDGITGVRELVAPSLVLLDPFDLKADGVSILETLAKLAGREVPFLCWTPLVDDAGSPDHDAAETFKEETSRFYELVRVQWADPRQDKFWGCQMTFPRLSNNLKTIVSDTIRELVGLMGEGWSIME